MTFRFAKETWEGIVADVPGGPSGSALSREGRRELLEKSALALRFSEMKVVYFQPLWLEVVDYLWEGVLGAAVWGGGGAVEDRSTGVIPSDGEFGRGVGIDRLCTGTQTTTVYALLFFSVSVFCRCAQSTC